MDLSKLGPTERTAAVAAAVLVVAGVVAAATYSIYSITWFAVLAGLGILFVLFQPQVAAGTSLPGSRGSLLVILGGIAGVAVILALLTALSLIFVAFGFPDVMFLVAVVAGIVVAWTGWQAFQAEGGKLEIGTASRATGEQDPAGATATSHGSAAAMDGPELSDAPTGEEPRAGA